MKILVDCPVCGKKDVPLNVEMNAGNGLREALDAVEKKIVIEALKETYGNRTAAAKLLRMEVWALRHLVKKHALESETF